MNKILKLKGLYPHPPPPVKCSDHFFLHECGFLNATWMLMVFVLLFGVMQVYSPKQEPYNNWRKYYADIQKYTYCRMWGLVDVNE